MYKNERSPADIAELPLYFTLDKKTHNNKNLFFMFFCRNKY